MFHFTKKRAVVMAVVGSLALAVGAYAYFTSTGTGSGSATVGTSAVWAVVPGDTTGGPMTPGGPIATIHYTVKNNSSGVQKLNNVAISVSDNNAEWSAGVTPVCSKDDFSIGSAVSGVTYNDATVVNVAAGETVTRTATIQMVNGTENQDSCKGKTPPLYLVAS
jgi:hypothetical protein